MGPATKQLPKWSTGMNPFRHSFFIHRRKVACLQSSLWSCALDVLCVLTDGRPAVVCLSQQLGFCPVFALG